MQCTLGGAPSSNKCLLTQFLVWIGSLNLAAKPSVIGVVVSKLQHVRVPDKMIRTLVLPAGDDAAVADGLL